MSEEQWLDIPGYEGYYQASDAGRVRSVERVITSRLGVSWLKRSVVLKPSLGSSGYLQVNLSVANKTKIFMVHRLIAMTFLGHRPEGLDTCHNDGNKLNNAVSNLRYDTRSANLMDEVARGTNHHASKTHCKDGHELTSENTFIRLSGGKFKQRVCLKCQRLNSKIHNALARDARLNPQEKAVIEELRREREAAMIATGRTT